MVRELSYLHFAGHARQGKNYSWKGAKIRGAKENTHGGTKVWGRVKIEMG